MGNPNASKSPAPQALPPDDEADVATGPADAVPEMSGGGDSGDDDSSVEQNVELEGDAGGSGVQ